MWLFERKAEFKTVAEGKAGAETIFTSLSRLTPTLFVSEVDRWVAFHPSRMGELMTLASGTARIVPLHAGEVPCGRRASPVLRSEPQRG